MSIENYTEKFRLKFAEEDVEEFAVETFNQHKLNYILTNKSKFEPKRSMFDDADYDYFKQAEIYLNKSRNGKIKVKYTQNKGVGRFFAKGNPGIQSIPKFIRNSISDNYKDYDIKNCHPTLLSHICDKLEIDCKTLNTYTNDRTNLLNLISKDLDITVEDAKVLMLVIMNGGRKVYDDLNKKNEFVEKFIMDIRRVSRTITNTYPDEFKAYELYREEKNRITVLNGGEAKPLNNLHCSFANQIFCMLESEILKSMREFAGSPKNCVLMFDGIMLLKDNLFDITGCEEYILQQHGVSLEIVEKPFDSAVEFPEQVPKYSDPSFEYFDDYNNLTETDITLEQAMVWLNNSCCKISQSGNAYLLCKNKTVHMLGDKSVEIVDKWIPQIINNVYDTLKVKCQIINPKFSQKNHDEYTSLSDKEQKAYPSHKIDTIQKYIYTTLGKSSKKLGAGFLESMFEDNKIKCYSNINFFPYSGKESPLMSENIFNTFSGFPAHNIPEPIELIDFEKSHIYNHFKFDFFQDQGELDHFLDHIADILQDPAQIKPSAHLFYGQQGTGKSLLYAFISKLVGMDQCLLTINTERYFDKFNIENMGKLIKVFEELEEKGSMMKYHNRLKGEISSNIEKIERKGIDSITALHSARYWFFTNNANVLNIEADDRRFTLHRTSDKHANNYDYFQPLWEEVSNPNFIKSTFNYFMTRKYEKRNVINAYTTDYKREQKISSTNVGITFLLDFVANNFRKIEDVNKYISVEDLKNKFKAVRMEDSNKGFNYKTLTTQLDQFKFGKPKQVRIDIDGQMIKKSCWTFNTYKIQEMGRNYYKDDTWILRVMDNTAVEDVEYSQLMPISC